MENIKVNQIYMDGGKLAGVSRPDATANVHPTFSWSVLSDAFDNKQQACRLRIYEYDSIVYQIDADMPEDKLLWDSGWVETDKQRMKYTGKPLPEGQMLVVGVQVRDVFGNESREAKDFFVNGLTDMSCASWITHPEVKKRVPTCFRKDFKIAEQPVEACLYVAGIGYHDIMINGTRANVFLDPAHTNYKKQVQYAVFTEISVFMKKGKNALAVEVADGWRYNNTKIFDTVFAGRPVEFFGDTALIAKLVLRFADGREQTIVTDDSWLCGHDAITDVSIFDGETFDARLHDPKWMRPGGGKDFVHAVIVPSPTEKLVPMTVEPIIEQEWYYVDSIYALGDGKYILDFGQNIAGVPHIVLPKGMQAGHTITMRMGEMLDEDGGLYNLPLRDAAQTDTYIASGDERDLEVWRPKFTYHGFRYIELTGYPCPERDDISAVALYTDIAKDSDFVCGSALVSKLYKNAIQTEKSNIHSILTDCPQRDERMGWMNDATVRFTATPYAFDIGRIFPKVIGDIHAEQRADGAFTCCAPFLFGQYPADPVCSSFLVAGEQTYLFCGNIELIEKAFPWFEAWERSLLSRSEDYIVNYSYYGDWAAPAYACRSFEDANSAVTDGRFMSTGFSYYNCKALARMAKQLGNADKQAEYEALADRIKTAMLEKWWDAESAKMAGGSQGSQAFSLWLGILPEADCQRAAEVMVNDLRERDYKFTTGNLCTLYMLEMLAKYGYVDDAWRILTSEEYPSYGFMIQNEATTVWERFELKKEDGMNSHNHPMYGSVYKWLYGTLCGIKPTEPGCTAFEI
ncbi:MAG: family 78 glycoside hydrolase catalytic domain, partial [Clostridia bacterium]|nr:family 78 glycoside hydrolase catalytic domain [Clostridia bacterium]